MLILRKRLQILVELCWQTQLLLKDVFLWLPYFPDYTFEICIHCHTHHLKLQEPGVYWEVHWLADQDFVPKESVLLFSVSAGLWSVLQHGTLKVCYNKFWHSLQLLYLWQIHFMGCPTWTRAFTLEDIVWGIPQTTAHLCTYIGMHRQFQITSIFYSSFKLESSNLIGCNSTTTLQY